MSVRFNISALAAVVLAAAFVVLSWFAPVVSFADTTTTHTTAATYLDEFVNHFGLENPWAQPTGGASFVGMGTNYNMYPTPCIVVISDCSTTLDSSGNLTCSGTGYYRLGTRYGSGSLAFTYYPNGGNSGLGSVSFGLGSNTYVYSVLDGDFNEYYSTLISVSFPATSDVLNNFEAWRRKLVTPSRTGGIAMITGGGDGVTVASSMRNVANTVRVGNMALTTTTSTTTTTATTTTTVTLPPYPYQTSPPFELPSDWTADYSETTPVPDVAYTVPAVTYTAPSVPSQAMEGVGFWFTIFTDMWEAFNLSWVVLLVVSVGFIVYLIWGR